MSVSVVTSCSLAGWEQYGRRFVETFDKFWPQDIPLYVVSEDALQIGTHSPRQVSFLDLKSDAAFTGFNQRNAENPRANGGRGGVTPHAMDKKSGYNFKMDAIRFSKKVFAVGVVANFVPAGRLIWLDADVVTIEPVPHEFLLTLPPADAAVAYLGRIGYHSECGFVGYNLDHFATRDFIQKYVGVYASDKVFKLKEWNDCFVFDWLRVHLHLPGYSIPHTSPSHPFVHSVLGQYMDHLKGRRKQRGASHDHPNRKR